MNEKTGLDESEIIIQNISQENIVSKVYINNYKQFKCCPNITSISKDTTTKLKVIMDNNDYPISNSDVFLIISHPLENSEEKFEEKNLNEIFKNNEYKEKGQKVFLVGYKKKEKKKEKKEDELVNKIKELEKEVLEDVIQEKKEEKVEEKKEEKVEEKKEEKIEEKKEEKIEEKKEEKIEEKKEVNKSSLFSDANYLIIFGLLVFVISFFLLKYLKK